MPQHIHVHMLPSLIESDVLHNGTAVIIDILRASSTITTALQNGASRVIPCGTPEEAVRLREQSASGSVLLGGERGGVRIEGFEFGNSPAEYAPEFVRGRIVAFTTTNGTKALLRALPAREILIGAFLNRSALVNRLARENQAIHLICAGTDGAITGEDVLFAGAVVDGLLRQSTAPNPHESAWILNDSAGIALGFWRQCTQESAGSTEVPSDGLTLLSRNVAANLQGSQGGKNLLSLGYGADITLCSQVDAINLIPQFSREDQCLLPTIGS